MSGYCGNPDCSGECAVGWCGSDDCDGSCAPDGIMRSYDPATDPRRCPICGATRLSE
jgi:hypothetical protein